MVLQSIYCTWVRGELAAQKEKEHIRRVKKARLIRDGMLKYLFGDEFYHYMVKNENKLMEAEKSWEEQQNKCDEWAEALFIWWQIEASNLERNNSQRCTNQKAVAEWERKQDSAKAKGWQVSWKQPVLRKLDAPLPQPVFNEDGDGGGNEKESRSELDNW